jgi:DNA-binding CsgD family transcriptional regulator
MSGTERLSERQRPATALVLVDSSFAPVSYDAEAIRILTFPQDPNDIQLLPKYIEGKLSALLGSARFSQQPSTIAFQSGRRHYAAQVFALSHHRKASPATRAFHVAYALLLERQDRKFVDFSTVANRFHLTPREEETLRFLMDGMTSKEIACQMAISPHTVKAFLRLVMSKMQVSTRSAIVGKILSISR